MKGVCPACGQTIPLRNGRIKPHKVTVYDQRTGGSKEKTCSGGGGLPSRTIGDK